MSEIINPEGITSAEPSDRTFVIGGIKYNAMFIHPDTKGHQLIQRILADRDNPELPSLEYKLHFITFNEIYHLNEKSIPPTNDEICEDILTADDAPEGKRNKIAGKERSNRTKGMKDIMGGDSKFDNSELNHDGIPTNSPEGWGENIFECVITKKFISNRVGGPIVFELYYYKGHWFLLCPFGENRARGIYQFMNDGFPIMDDDGNDIFNATQKKNLFDYFSDNGNPDFKYDNLFKSFKKQVVDNENDAYKNLNYNNIKAMRSTCGDCKLAYDLFQKYAWIGITIEQSSPEVLRNNVEAEAKMQAEHSPIQQCGQTLDQFLPSELRSLEKIEINSILEDINRGVISTGGVSKQANKLHNDASKSTSVSHDRNENGGNHKGRYLARLINRIISPLDLNGNISKVSDDLLPSQIDLIDDREGKATLKQQESMTKTIHGKTKLSSVEKQEKQEIQTQNIQQLSRYYYEHTDFYFERGVMQDSHPRKVIEAISSNIYDLLPEYTKNADGISGKNKRIHRWWSENFGEQVLDGILSRARSDSDLKINKEHIPSLIEEIKSNAPKIVLDGINKGTYKDDLFGLEEKWKDVNENPTHHEEWFREKHNIPKDTELTRLQVLGIYGESACGIGKSSYVKVAHKAIAKVVLAYEPNKSRDEMNAWKNEFYANLRKLLEDRKIAPPHMIGLKPTYKLNLQRTNQPVNMVDVPLDSIMRGDVSIPSSEWSHHKPHTYVALEDNSLALEASDLNATKKKWNHNHLQLGCSSVSYTPELDKEFNKAWWDAIYMTNGWRHGDSNYTIDDAMPIYNDLVEQEKIAPSCNHFEKVESKEESIKNYEEILHLYKVER